MVARGTLNPLALVRIQARQDEFQKLESALVIWPIPLTARNSVACSGFGTAKYSVGSLNIVNKVIVKLTKQPSLAKVLALKFPIVC